MWCNHTISDISTKMEDVLKTKGPTSITHFENNMANPKPLIHAAIGWLCAQKKIRFSNENNNIFLNLKSPEEKL